MSILNKIPRHSTERSDEPTEGEIFIQEFLRSEGINYISEVRIDNLIGDTKSYRRADFYLPDYKVYIEFFGEWNKGEEQKDRYKEKKKVFKQNKIPCIYFYPENLGNIHYTFSYRLRHILREYNLKRELFRYNSICLFYDKFNAFVWLAIAVIALIMLQFNTQAELYCQAFLVAGLVAAVQIVRIGFGYKKFFRDNYSYVNFIRE